MKSMEDLKDGSGDFWRGVSGMFCVDLLCWRGGKSALSCGCVGAGFGWVMAIREAPVVAGFGGGELRQCGETSVVEARAWTADW